MIKIERILTGLDFSEHSKVALRYAAELAKVFDAEVLVCHIVESAALISQLPPAGEGYFPPNAVELERSRAEEDCRRLVAEAGIARGRVLIGTGSPFVELIRFARENNVDLLIVGTHGRGAVAHMLLGSVAERVVRKAPCPVLTVREGEHDFVMP